MTRDKIRQDKTRDEKIREEKKRDEKKDIRTNTEKWGKNVKLLQNRKEARIDSNEMSQWKSYRVVTGEEVKWYQNKNGKMIKDEMRWDEIIYDWNK